MNQLNPDSTYDYVIIGSGFGGSVSAMRLTEKGYRVLVLERGKRIRTEDFPKSNWIFWKYLWNPTLCSFGILQISTLSGMLVLHGAGVGGGSLGYANVLMEPDDKLFNSPAWKELADWKTILRPHYDTAKRMLGVTRNPELFPADHVSREIAEELGRGASFQSTDVGVYFGADGQAEGELLDPYFGGQGPVREVCIQCGGCMVGCRYNAKNTLDKNYLYFAEKWGAEVQAEAEVRDIRPLPDGQPDGARYEIVYRRSTAWIVKPQKVVRTRNVIISAGVMGTLKLLFRCRDITASLPKLSSRLGDRVRTNSEELLGATARRGDIDYSKGLAISSVFQADDDTMVEPVRYPSGSSLMRFLAAPLISAEGNILTRLLKLIWIIIRHPYDFLRSQALPHWADRTTIFLVMQTKDSRLRVQYRRSPWSLFRHALVSEPEEREEISAKISLGHQITRSYAEKTNSIPSGSISESLLNMPATAHILGGCPMGRSADDGVVDLDCQVFNYPGLYVVDGSIMPANPGINPSLTISALAEYAMSRMPVKEGAAVQELLKGNHN